MDLLSYSSLDIHRNMCPNKNKHAIYYRHRRDSKFKKKLTAVIDFTKNN